MTVVIPAILRGVSAFVTFTSYKDFLSPSLDLLWYFQYCQVKTDGGPEGTGISNL